MIYSVKGKLIHTEGDLAVVECGGVGYACRTTFYTLQKIAGSDEVMLYTYLAVREDAVELFGFADREELKCFKLLISVSGVGPKAAISILSSNSPSQFALAVAGGDAKALSKAKGIGAKTAQRIVLELKDKIAKENPISFRGNAGTPVQMPVGTAAEEAVAALVVLGYSEGEAMSAVGKAEPGLSVEEMIKVALRQLARL